jgi:hypothetical protein
MTLPCRSAIPDLPAAPLHLPAHERAVTATTRSWKTRCGRLWNRHVFYCLLLAGIGVSYFWPHISGAGTFIGDSDRLETYLNIRQHSVDGLHELGRVPTWDERLFCGFCTSGLYWMCPELDPLAYAEALFPRAALFRLSGYVSCLFLIGAALAMYALAFDVARQAFCAFVGALLYVSSSFSVTRICQVDWAYVILICIPLGLLIIRRAAPAKRYWLLTGLVAFLLLLTFLQEVAYVLAFFLVYSIYRSIARRSWQPLVIGGAALYAGTCIALPRLYGVYEEFQLLHRTSALQTTQPPELLRWFNDGIFGRHLAEATSLSNGLNLHEGLQLHSSVFAALLIVAAAVRWRRRAEVVAGIAFFVVLTCIVGMTGEYRTVLLIALGSVLLLGIVWRVFGPPEATSDQDSDFTFHLGFLTISLAIILIPEVRWLLHLAFFRIDFTHSRLTVVVLTSTSLLATLALKGLFAPGTTDRAPGWRGIVFMATALPAAAGLVWGMDAAAHHVKEMLSLDWCNAQLGMRMLRAEAARTVVALAIGGLGIALWLVLRRRRLADLIAATAGWAMVLGAVAYASNQLSGSHTWTFPVAFAGSNRFMAPVDSLTPPVPEQRQHMRRLLEADAYRTALVAAPRQYGGFVEPHLAESWGIRLVGGYPGLPRRLCDLPWPAEVRQRRSVSFANERCIHWGLLSLLNTKYVAFVDAPFYFNTEPCFPVAPSGGSQPRIYMNPLPVLPRQFFVKSVQPRGPLSHEERGTAETEERAATTKRRNATGDCQSYFPAPRVWLTVESEDTAVLSWRFADASDVEFSVEMASILPGGRFLRAAKLPGNPNNTSALKISSLDSPGIFKYRVRARQGGRRWCSDYSDVVTVIWPSADVPVPTAVRAQRIAAEEVVLSWHGMPGVFYEVDIADAAHMGFERWAWTEAGASSIRIPGLGLQAYGFRVRAERDGRWSPHSKEAWIMAAGPSDCAVSRRLKELFPADVRESSIVEGDLDAQDLDTSGTIQAHYQGDRVTLDVTPSPKARFLVLNELYHPRWQAFADGQEVAIYPTNVFMRGVLLPPQTARVELRFVPFLHTKLGRCLLIAGLVQAVFLGWLLRRTMARLGFTPRRPTALDPA